MEVFLSWSGPRSKEIAEALKVWIPRVIQATKPWMSEKNNIAAGTRWSNEIAGKLQSTHVGIICVTPENQHNPWLMFEAGALSKIVSEAYVCPYLFGLPISQLSGPISHNFTQSFQIKDLALPDNADT